MYFLIVINFLYHHHISVFTIALQGENFRGRGEKSRGGIPGCPPPSVLISKVITKVHAIHVPTYWIISEWNHAALGLLQGPDRASIWRQYHVTYVYSKQENSLHSLLDVLLTDGYDKGSKINTNLYYSYISTFYARCMRYVLKRYGPKTLPALYVQFFIHHSTPLTENHVDKLHLH